MPIAIGGNQINKAYLGTTEIQKMYLGADLVFDNSALPSELTPIMTNFRVNNTTPNIIEFDTPIGPVTGLSSQGFIVSGNSVQSVDGTANTITLDSPFTYWDNNTIRLESGDGTVFDFTLQYITNNIVEPDANTNRYVAVNGTGDGTSEGSASSLSYMASNATSGQTWWIKAGNYGNNAITISNSGTPTSPIKFIGYKTDWSNGGDITENYWSYVKNVGLDSAEMPTMTLTNVTTTRGIVMQARENIILKNFQIEGGVLPVNIRDNTERTAGSTNVVLERCNVYKGGDAGFDSAYDTNHNSPLNKNIRFTDSICINTTTTNFNVIGDHCLTKDCESWGDNAYADTSDYGFAMGGSNSIAINLEGGLKEDSDSSVGHGMTIKGNGVTSEYNLAQDVNVYNCYLAIECKHHESKYNVMRNVNALDTLSGSIPLGGINCSNGASYNTFESCYVQRPDRSTYYGEGPEDGENTDRGNNNLFLNCIFDQLLNVLYDDGGGSMETFENKYIGCTFIGRSGSTSRVCWDTSGTRDNSFIQCYFEDINNETLNGNTDAINYTNCNFSSIGFTPTDATGSKTVDMNLDANFKPQASFDSFKVAYDSRNKYDYNNNQRASDFTTPCAVKSDEEIAGGVAPPAGEEIYPTGNAASIGGDEGNSTSPWTVAACDLVSSIEQSTDGTWSIKQTSTGTGASAQVLNLTLEVGETYNISIWALAVVGTDNEQNFDVWEGFDGFSRVNMIADGAWHEYTWSLVANATSGIIRIYTASGAANTPGEICYSDKISIIKT